MTDAHPRQELLGVDVYETAYASTRGCSGTAEHYNHRANMMYHHRTLCSVEVREVGLALTKPSLAKCQQLATPATTNATTAYHGHLFRPCLYQVSFRLSRLRKTYCTISRWLQTTIATAYPQQVPLHTSLPLTRAWSILLRNRVRFSTPTTSWSSSCATVESSESISSSNSSSFDLGRKSGATTTSPSLTRLSFS